MILKKGTQSEDNARISTVEKWAIAGVVLVGLIAHVYMYTNRIVNHDAVFSTNYSGSTITSGRWLLYILSEIAYFYNGNYVTPWGIGIATLAIYAACAVILVKIFQIKDKKMAALIGSVLICFPTITANNLYLFTTHYYAFAFLLICAAAWFAVKNKLWAYGLSSIFVVCSLAIYQAYLPSLLCIFVLLVIMDCLDPQKAAKDVLQSAIAYVGLIVVSLILYLILNKFFLWFFDAEMDTYMGMDSMGKLDVTHLLQAIVACYKNFFSLFTTNQFGINEKGWIRLALVVLTFGSIGCIVYACVSRRIKGLKAMLLCAAVLVFPIAVCAIHIMVGESKGINTMTMFSAVFLLLTPIVLFDRLWDRPKVCTQKTLMAVLSIILCLLIGYYSSLANETYLALEYSNKNVNAYFTELVTQIKMQDGYSPDKRLALIGKIDDESLPEINCDYIIRGCYPTSELINLYSREFFITMHCGYSYDMLSDEEKEVIMMDQRFIDMPCYPENGGIQVIDNVIVVKFS